MSKPLYPYETTCYQCQRATKVILVRVDPERPNTAHYHTRCSLSDCGAVYSDITLENAWPEHDLGLDERTKVEEPIAKPKRRARLF